MPSYAPTHKQSTPTSSSTGSSFMLPTAMGAHYGGAQVQRCEEICIVAMFRSQVCIFKHKEASYTTT